MPVTDPVADMLTRVRNAAAAGHEIRVDADITLKSGDCTSVEGRGLYSEI